MKEHSKGITLIALVITIIVLLILAGTSITMIIGNDGIIDKANKAKKDTNIADAEEAVELQVITSFDNNGKYNKDLAKLNIKNNLNNPQATVTDNGDGTLSVNYKDQQLIVDAKGKVFLDTEKVAITNESFVGCYADFENESGERIPDGKPDGIIFADKAVGNTYVSQGAGGTVPYTIPKVESGLKKYYVRPEKVADERWSTESKDVISPINASGEERFYVMALEDVKDGGTDIKATWYKMAAKMLDSPSYTSKDFGTGKENTKRMIARMKCGGDVPDEYKSNPNFSGSYGAGFWCDVWYLEGVKTKNTKDWFVPSDYENLAFIKELRINKGNYGNYNLKSSYWSSTQAGPYAAGCIRLNGNNFSCLNDVVDNTSYIRLATTF